MLYLGKPLQTEVQYYKRPITSSTKWKCFLLDQLDGREILYTINFIKICQKSFYIQNEQNETP